MYLIKIYLDKAKKKPVTIRTFLETVIGHLKTIHWTVS